MSLTRFVLGQQYEVGSLIGALLLAEGWAEPVHANEPDTTVPRSEFEPEIEVPYPRNLTREIYPPYYDGPTSLAADRRRRRRHK